MNRKSEDALKRKIMLMTKQLAVKDKQLAMKDKQLARKDEQLALERAMWSSESTKDRLSRGDAPLMHRLETLDDIMHDDGQMRSISGLDGIEFSLLLDWFRDEVQSRGELLLFRDEGHRDGDPGNRCKLSVQYALLMLLIRERSSEKQEMLSAMFGIDQGRVSEYLAKLLPILEDILPTAKTISEAVALCKNASETKDLLPGRDGGEIIIDGTRTPVMRPSDKEKRKGTYSGKTKSHTYNTLVGINQNGVISCISPTEPGSANDVRMAESLGESIPRMANSNIRQENRVRCMADLGFIGIEKRLPGVTAVLPAKRSKDSDLSEAQKKKNKKINKRRVPVEHAIGRMKNYSILTEPYGGTPEEFNREMNIVTGLVNFRLLFRQLRNDTGVYGRLMARKRAELKSRE